MSAYETLLKDHLIATLPKEQNASGITGSMARANITTRSTAYVTDWDAFFQYVKANEAWDLLFKRVNDAAAAERWDNGEQIPGVEKFPLVNVSVTKI